MSSTTHKAIQFTAASQQKIIDAPTPTPVSGQVLLRVLTIPIMPNMKMLFEGKMPFPLFYPFVPGAGCIGRVEAVGPDAAVLSVGDLVYCDPTIRGRDDPAQKIVHTAISGFTPEAQRVNKGWVDGFAADFGLKPLESCVKLDEQKLVKEMGYSYEELFGINAYLLPYSGLRRARFTPGDTVIVAWGTGRLGNATTELALAMGAGRVIAVGRDNKKLAEWASTYPAQLASRISTYALTADAAADSAAIIALTPGGRGADIYYDFSPPQVAFGPVVAPHIKTLIGACAIQSRVVFMGMVPLDVAIPYSEIVRKDMTIVGGFMYEQDVPREIARLTEAGVLDFRADKKGVYGFPYEHKTFEGLEKFGDAMEYADVNRLPRLHVFVRP